MLNVYLDRGAKWDSTDEIMCVVSVIFKPTRYKQFIRPWNRMLRAWRASAFHATDFYPGGGEFRRDTLQRKQLFADDSKRIPRIIGEYAQHILIVSFRPREFEQVASAKWKEAFGTSVHSHAVQLALIANGWWRYEKYRSERFEYFMESGDPDEVEVQETVSEMRKDKDSGTADVIRVNSFRAVDKGMARGLEAADCVAWHWNKHYMDRVRSGKENDARKDFAVLCGYGKVHDSFATGDKLKYFFSLAPPHVLGVDHLPVTS